MVAHLKDRLILRECTVLGAVNGEILAVLETDATLIAHEVDVTLVFTDVLRPSAVQRDDRAFGTDHADNGVVHVVGAVVLRGTCPHVGVCIALHVLAKLAEGFTRNGLNLRVAAAVHNDIKVMYTPVNQSTATCNRLCGERAAEARNGTVCTEAGMYMVDIAELAVVDILFDEVNAVIEAVDNTDIEHLAGLVLNLLHLKGFLVGSCSRLLAQNILACAQCVNGNSRVNIVRGADGNSFNFRVCQDIVIIHNSGAAAVLFNGSLCALRDDVAEILDFCLRVVHVRRDVCCICDRTATNNGNFHWNTTPLRIFCGLRKILFILLSPFFIFTRRHAHIFFVSAAERMDRFEAHQLGDFCNGISLTKILV